MRNILIIFQAATQETETLALAFGLGAVQAGANIRLRHLNPSPSVELAHAGYGTLRTEDLGWAEGVGIFLESIELPGYGELMAALDELAPDSAPVQKWAYLFDADPGSQSKRLVGGTLRDRGFREFDDDLSSSVASVESMTQTGRRFAGITVT